MTAPPPDPPRRSNGCLWGCLIVLALIFLPMVLAGGYGAWFFWQGWRHSPVLRATAEFVGKDGLAHLALGEGIHVTGVEGFSMMPGFDSHSQYRIALEGSKGDGTLEVSADSRLGRVTFDSLMLTGPDGRRYDLMTHQAQPPPVPSGSI